MIRQREQSETTPIIFVTAYGADELNVDHYAGGAVDFLFAPVPPDELRAKVSVFAAIYRKATELAARAETVQASAEEFKLLVEVVPVGVFRTDAQDRLVYTNPRWSELTGIPATDAVGQDRCTMTGRRQDLVVDRRAILDADGTTTGWVGTLTEVSSDAYPSSGELLPAR